MTARRKSMSGQHDSHHRSQTADGQGSATTVNVGNSAITHGDECQDMALMTAGRCMHGAKNNRAR